LLSISLDRDGDAVDDLDDLDGTTTVDTFVESGTGSGVGS
jgi:hypothetical protein